MCTLGAKKIHESFFIFKNRDREYKSRCSVIREKGKASKLIVVDNRGHCEGLNEYGIGFVEATLQPFPRIRFRSISQIARRILDQNNLPDAIGIIRRSKTSCNVIISDEKDAYIVEKTPFEFAATKLKTQGVITNLSIKLNRKNGSKLKSVREWARARHNRARHLVKDVRSVSGIRKLLSDKEGYPDRSILGGKGWWIPTRASFIFDLKRRKILFCNGQPGSHPFKGYML